MDNKLKIKNKNSQWYFKTKTKLKCKRYEAILKKAKNKKNTWTKLNKETKNQKLNKFSV